MEEPLPIKIEIIKSPIKKKRCSRRMPMIKKRRKVDKKKRKCLYGAENIPKLDKLIDNKISQQPLVKKTKNSRIVDVKIEKQHTEDMQLKEESKLKRQPVNKITEDEKTEKLVKEIEVVEENVSKSSKLPSKTKQW